MLLYILDMGSSEQTIVRQAIMAGEPIPDRIKDAPRLIPGLQFYLNAFFELDSERDMGWGIGPIKRRAIWDYAVDYELDYDEREDLLYYIREMDNAHIAQVREKERTA